MSYLKQIWRDLVSGGTTLTADRLNHMEDGIAAANDAWDSVSRVSGVVAPASSWTVSYTHLDVYKRQRGDRRDRRARYRARR